jgi:hypothetical protein
MADDSAGSEEPPEDGTPRKRREHLDPHPHRINMWRMRSITGDPRAAVRIDPNFPPPPRKKSKAWKAYNPETRFSILLFNRREMPCWYPVHVTRSGEYWVHWRGKKWFFTYAVTDLLDSLYEAERNSKGREAPNQ